MTPTRKSTHPIRMSHPSLKLDDVHDALLLERVAPKAWRNPEPKAYYHLVVVGAGPAGLVAAAGAAGLGARVALVERELMGGDCLNFGCVPSKALLRSAHRADIARCSREFGVAASDVSVDFEAVLERLRRVRAELSSHDSVERFRALGVDVFLGAARFGGEDSVLVADQRLRFKRALICTGTRPRSPDILGLSRVPYYTNETIFSIEQLPQRLVVLGGGPVGCELSQAFARFGSSVSLVDHGDRLLQRDDPLAVRVLAEQFRRDGIKIWLGAPVREIDGDGGVRLHLNDAAGTRLDADALIVATGRRPNIDTLDLARAGVEVTAEGVEVDDRLRTSNPRIFAAGDVCSGALKFTHAADAMARIALANALFFGRKRASDLTVPWVTYTSPEVAHVGLTEGQARARGRAVLSFTVPMAELDRSAVDGDTAGFARVYIARKRGTLLGATMVAERAGEAIGELALAVTHRLTMAQLAATVHAYPTQAEGWKRAADSWSRSRLTPRVARLLKWWLGVFGSLP
jgi:pyruvate/2-oxoglutarate dehydrogenase complex dihydrolipoamide dehydrogenase (E3) component